MVISIRIINNNNDIRRPKRMRKKVGAVSRCEQGRNVAVALKAK